MIFNYLFFIYITKQVPLSYIPEPVYKASADWIDQIPDMKVSNFVKWASKNIRTDLAEEEVIIDCEKDEFHEKVKKKPFIELKVSPMSL